jgi:hypothetical protein
MLPLRYTGLTSDSTDRNKLHRISNQQKRGQPEQMYSSCMAVSAYT